MVGINEVSWTLPRPRQPAPTPHLSSLAGAGVALDSLYTLPVCSPSRAALLTGTYPFKLGLQRGFGKQTPEVELQTKLREDLTITEKAPILLVLA